MALLPNDIVFHALSYLAHPADVCRFALTCREWHKRIHTDDASDDETSKLWRSLVENHRGGRDLSRVVNTLHGVISGGEGAPPLALCRYVTLVVERAIRQAKRSLRSSIDEILDRRRNGTRLYPSDVGKDDLTKDNEEENIDDDDDDEGLPYPRPPTTGTTATETPNADGQFSRPVYYDWEKNWDKVSKLIKTDEVQRVLWHCLEEIGGLAYPKWIPGVIWPLNFYDGKYDAGDPSKHDVLVAKYLPSDVKKGFNCRVVDWIVERIDGVLDEHDVDGDVSCAVAYHFRKSIFNAIPSPSETVLDAEIVLIDAITGVDESDLDNDIDSGAQRVVRDADALMNKHASHLLRDIQYDCRKYLYGDDSPLRSILMLTEHPYYFLPFNYKLAQLVSPPDTVLKVYKHKISYDWSENDCDVAVVDEERNIVFDSNSFFRNRSANELLYEAKKGSWRENAWRNLPTFGAQEQEPETNRGTKRKRLLYRSFDSDESDSASESGSSRESISSSETDSSGEPDSSSESSTATTSD